MHTEGPGNQECPKILHTFQGWQAGKAIPGIAVTSSASVEGRGGEEVTERMGKESLKPTGEERGHSQSRFS
jgi:hypothetical protein